MIRARRLLYFSRPVPSGEALSLGLLDEVVPDQDAVTRTRQVARELAAGPTQAYGQIKYALFLGMAPQLFSSLVLEDEFTRVSMQSADASEGSRAWAEKRPPEFTGE